MSVVLERGADRIRICSLPPRPGGADGAIAAKADCTIAISHTPDQADQAAAQGVDLYLCGHTHGGQVRIPLWGAIVTNCESGKKYEAGLYRNGSTVIHTSRGLGLEPRPAPQVRFLCRPEISLISERS
jgi:predicted MPP superfamily phosphohydrolase